MIDLWKGFLYDVLEGSESGLHDTLLKILHLRPDWRCRQRTREYLVASPSSERKAALYLSSFLVDYLGFDYNNAIERVNNINIVPW